MDDQKPNVNLIWENSEIRAELVPKDEALEPAEDAIILDAQSSETIGGYIRYLSFFGAIVDYHPTTKITDHQFNEAYDAITDKLKAIDPSLVLERLERQRRTEVVILYILGVSRGNDDVQFIVDEIKAEK